MDFVELTEVISIGIDYNASFTVANKNKKYQRTRNAGREELKHFRLDNCVQ